MMDAVFALDPEVKRRVSEEEYLAHYAEHFYEWDDGELIPIMSSHEDHDALFQFLMLWLQAYLALRPIDVLRVAPFIIHFPNRRKFREPDVMLILNENRDRLHPTYMLGAPDVAIEIVSDESQKRDYETKFSEYQSLGVQEYWIIDSLVPQATFYRLNDEGEFINQTPAPDDSYTTPLLPDFQLPLAHLWADPLPNIFQIAEQVKAFLGENS